MSPQRSQFLLTTNIPNHKFNSFIVQFFHIESNCGNSTNYLPKFQGIQNGGLASTIKTQHHNFTLLFGYFFREQTFDEITHIIIKSHQIINFKMESESLYSSKGDQFMKEANKKLKGSFFGNLMSNKTQRAEEAVQLYKQAATNYKLAKRWDDAANAYLECVECDKMCKGGQAADFYQEAANMKQRVNTAECIKLLETSISLYVSSNRVSNIAKTQKRIAEIYEKDGQYTLAIKFYKDAADNYSLEQNQTSSYNSSMLKVVDIGIYAAAPDYGELIKILESIADKYMQNKLTAPSAKELYFKAILLFLANDDVIGANQAMQKYLANDPTFLQTRQQKFCVALIKSVKDQDLVFFSSQCYKFNEIIPLDKWKTTILTKIKGYIPEQGSETKNDGKAEVEDIEL